MRVNRETACSRARLGNRASGLSRDHQGAVNVGVTLVEMIIVVALVGILAGVTYPSVAAGLDSIRMASACDQIAAFINAAADRAQRRQHVIEIAVAPTDNSVSLASTEAGFTRRYTLPAGLRISAVHPPTTDAADTTRRFLMYPGGAPPSFGIELVNSRGSKRTVRLDPTTGVAQVLR